MTAADLIDELSRISGLNTDALLDRDLATGITAHKLKKIPGLEPVADLTADLTAECLKNEPRFKN